MIKNFKWLKKELEVLAAALRVLLQIWPKLTFREIGRRPPGGSLMVRVDWKLLWNDSLWCLEGVSVDFCSFENTFILPTKIPKANPPLFHFRSGLVRRNLSGVWLRSEVAWSFRLGSFLLKCSHIIHWHDPFEFAPKNYFGKSRGKIESTISTL